MALPSELLEEITLYAIGYYDDLHAHPDIIDTHGGPGKHTQICARWRSVVLASPRAWSDVVITKCYSINGLSLLQTCLDRSKDAMLRANRLLELELHIPESMFSYLQQLQPQTLRTISRLSFEQTSGISPLIASCLDIISTIPKLEELTLRNILNLPLTINSPNHLTALGISLSDDFKENDLLILCGLPNLITLSVYRHLKYKRSCEDYPPLPSSVYRWRIHEMSYKNYPPLSMNLELQHLRKLEVRHPGFLKIQGLLYPQLADLTQAHPNP
ncbi:hypothetical protein BT96DRAFT_1013447 [Gymnopus androsaceus JB14]|uniref:F-box domain-containing protein n=1 Tax=Gymnopus androsaceus JB14 TaxID=1447944 RepID=A0A6A4IH05_9AGAR|nr:hypothetical protein BT96DRAFT_1013447 [Gymnopus androsaceus JB14]